MFYFITVMTQTAYVRCYLSVTSSANELGVNPSAAAGMCPGGMTIHVKLTTPKFLR